MNPELLTRPQFREAVFARDGGKCVICGEPGQDAHHIMERRLFEDGGYYVDNGATLCSTHHLAAENTTLSPEEIRRTAGISNIILPPQLTDEDIYDKWGNIILKNGLRLRGELFDEEPVQKILQPILHLFTNRVKFPRTYHLPWSPGLLKNDRRLSSIEDWEGREVVITEKMDGENTTMYQDYIHARSLDFEPHPARERIKALWGQIGHNIPTNWRLCGENLTAVHSIKYDKLPSIFLVFQIWNERNICLSWDETVTYSELLGLATVPVIYRGVWHEKMGRELSLDWVKSEGFVVRPAGEFTYRQYKEVVGKYVRANHVLTPNHWMRSKLVFNGVK